MTRTTPTPRGGAAATAKAVGAALALLALLVGIPAALIALAGNPLPNQLPSLEQVRLALTTPDNGALFLGALVWVGWLGWVSFAVPAVVEIVAQLRQAPSPRLPLLGAQQHMVSVLVAAVVVAIGAATVAAPTAAATATSSSSDSGAHAIQTTTSTTLNDPATVHPPEAVAGSQDLSGPTDTDRTAGADQAATPAGPTHVVQPGDTLWDLAETYLGDGGQWRQIAALNTGIFEGGAELQPGWTLTLPAGAGAVASTGQAAAAQASAERIVTVDPGDTLSAIAQDELGDADRYPEIAAASADIVQPDGATLTDPDLIRPGWQLTVPGQTAAPAAPPVDTTTPAVDPAQQPTAASAPEQLRLAESQPVESQPVESQPDTAVPSAAAPSDAQLPDSASTPGPALNDTDTSTDTSTDETAPDDTAADDAFGIRTAAGIGSLLAAGLLTLLGAKRARQRRRRAPGQRIALPSEPAQSVELEIRAVEDPVALEHVDTALRDLAIHHRLTSTPLPQLRAARLTTSHLELYLAQPAPLPTPWAGTSDQTVWTLPHRHLLAPHPDASSTNTDTTSTTSTGLSSDDALGHGRRVDTRAPWPTLVTIGQDSEDAHLLLDLEHLTALAIDGPPTTTLDILTALAVELATSPWADDLQVTLVGMREDLPEAFDTGRVRHMVDVDRLLVELEGRAADVTRVLQSAGVGDLAEARGRGVALDAWAPEIVILADGVPAHLRRRLDDLLGQVPRVAIAAVTGARQPLGEWVLTLSDQPDHPTIPADQSDPLDAVTAAGAVSGVLAPAGIHVRPQTLPQEQYDLVLQMLRTADDVAVPGPAWATGLPTHEPALDDLPPSANDTTAAAHAHDEGVEHSRRVVDLRALPNGQDPADVVDDTATAGPDAEPEVVEVDLSGPYLEVLGKVEVVGATGTPPRTAKSNHTGPVTELLAFLALHGPATGEDIAQHLRGRTGHWTANTVHTRAAQARKWLGADESGKPYLPSATDAGRYELAIPSTWDVWLDLVGDDAATTPTPRLLAALDRIKGQPFVGAKAPAYGWSEVLQQEMLAAIVDVAHEVARRALLDGDAATARKAAAIGRMVDPAAEICWRDALRAEYIAANPDGVQRIKGQLYSTVDDPDTDLEDETEELIDDIDGRAMAL